MKVPDSLKSYVAARKAAFAANAVTVQTAFALRLAKRELDHAEAQVLLAIGDFAQANADHEAAAAEYAAKAAHEVMVKAKKTLRVRRYIKSPAAPF